MGHAYLRRWLRGFGWFAATFAAVLLLVPPEVIEALNAGATVSNPVEALPPVIVVLASAVDAYLLARATHDESGAAVRPAAAGAGARADGADGGNDADGANGASQLGAPGRGAGAAAGGASTDDEAPACPNCGKELDADLDFCPWCTTRLDWADAGSPEATDGDDGDGDSRS
ncbi:zinc ribbon domain-containing protein [Halobaculum halobium]|uniref:DUF7575 domain-containing protein n=1 Tax=Halobaculum halobium TaxID=3032281 RepID=UPI00360A1886